MPNTAKSYLRDELEELDDKLSLHPNVKIAGFCFQCYARLEPRNYRAISGNRRASRKQKLKFSRSNNGRRINLGRAVEQNSEN